MNKVWVVHDGEGDVSTVFEEKEEAERFAAGMADGRYYAERISFFPSSRPKETA
jgi:hypothetical protein